MILITGHCGFIGKNIVERLSKYPITGYDIKEGYDIRDSYSLDVVFQQSLPSDVIHLAALVNPRMSAAYPEEFVSINVMGTWNIVKMCEKYNARLMFFSSSSVYGDKHDPETPRKEEDAKNPVSLYGITKLAGEHIVNSSKAKTTILRPFTVYGEHGRKDQVMTKWANQVKNNQPITFYYGDVVSHRGYTYVGDIAWVLNRLLECEWPWDHEDFNIGGVEKITLDELLSIYTGMFPDVSVSRELRPLEDIAQEFPDISKAVSILNYNPEPILKTRVRKIVREFMEQ